MSAAAAPKNPPLTPKRIRILTAAVGEGRIQGRMAKLVRGMIEPDQFGALVIPEYQRLAMKNQKHDELKQALSPNGIGIPDDLLLCTSSTGLQSVGAGEFIVRSPGLYVLDGHQRVAAAWALLDEGRQPDTLGVKIFFGTSYEEEVLTFYQVNRLQTPVSTHVLLRNSGSIAAIESLRAMANDDPNFPQVQWDQLKKPGDVITAHMLFEVAVILHGYTQKGAIEYILEALEEITAQLGTELLVENTKAFFEVMYKCFGTTETRRFLYRIDLLRGMAKLFSEYQDFWDSKNPEKLRVRAKDLNKIKVMPTHHVEADLRTTGAANTIFRNFRSHLEKQREKGLTLRERP